MPCTHSALVDEALDEEAIRVVARAAVLTGEDVLLDIRSLDAHVRDGAFDVHGIAHAKHHRLPRRHVRVERFRQAVGPERCAHARGVQIAVLALAEGFLARPDHVDRRARKLLGHCHDHAHVIAVHPPAEAAADQRLVMVNILRRHAGLFGGDDQRLQHHGRRMPEIDAVLCDARRAIERLHRGVIAERRVVGGIDGAGAWRIEQARRIADIAQQVFAGSLQSCVQAVVDLLGRLSPSPRPRNPRSPAASPAPCAPASSARRPRRCRPARSCWPSARAF